MKKITSLLLVLALLLTLAACGNTGGNADQSSGSKPDEGKTSSTAGNTDRGETVTITATPNAGNQLRPGAGYPSGEVRRLHEGAPEHQGGAC